MLLLRDLISQTHTERAMGRRERGDIRAERKESDGEEEREDEGVHRQINIMIKTKKNDCEVEIEAM